MLHFGVMSLFLMNLRDFMYMKKVAFFSAVVANRSFVELYALV